MNSEIINYFQKPEEKKHFLHIGRALMYLLDQRDQYLSPYEKGPLPQNTIKIMKKYCYGTNSEIDIVEDNLLVILPL